MSDNSLPPILIIDNGSGYIKAGLSTEKLPSVEIPSLIGKQLLRYGEKIDLSKFSDDPNKIYKDIMIGDEVLPYRNLLELSHPIDEGIIKNEDDLEKLWDYVITNKLKIEDVSDKKIIITEAPMNPLENKIKICEILFEKIGVDALNIEPQAKLSLYCHGIDTGLVIDSGDGVTHCIPISNGTILRNYIEKLNIAGRHITEYLIRLLQVKGYAFNSSSDFEFVRELKEKLCFVSNDIELDRKLDKETTFFNSFYLLPDGSRIRISNEKFEAPEILFNPHLFGKDLEGIAEIVHKSINSCPIDSRVGLYKTMVLSGANTLFPGFATRFENELRKKYIEKNLANAKEKKIKININVLDHPNRKYSVFIGAGIIANYYNTQESIDYWITRDEWLECEENINKENLLKEKCQNYFKEKLMYNEENTKWE